MSQIKELKNMIAASLWILPCTEEELMERDFLKTKSEYGTQRLLMQMENDKAIYYKNGLMHTYKKWAMENLQEYELDFRTEKEKLTDGMTDFAKEVYGLK